MSEDDPIPVAVVGTGNMGSNHVRVYDKLPEANLVEIVEPDEERAAEIASKYDVTVRESVSELTAAEAATVSVPNDQHRTVSEQLFEIGLDVLVEKPLAPSIRDAEAIIHAAEEAGGILQVGHIERFNPAVETLSEILAEEELIAVEAHRLGPFNEHLADESVIFDLMLHDLDIINNIVAGELRELNAAGANPRSRSIDHAIAIMEYDNGVLGSMVASHVTHGKIRQLDITTREAFIMLNYQQQEITIQRRGIEQTTEFANKSGYRTETVTERPYIRNREPLKNELEAFLRAIRDRTEPVVDGQTGLKGVRLAQQVVDSIEPD